MQEIEIGPMSGNSNVVHYLTTRGMASPPEVVQAIMQAAKNSAQILSRAEIDEIVQKLTATKA
jgi:hypothetical protein